MSTKQKVCKNCGHWGEEPRYQTLGGPGTTSILSDSRSCKLHNDPELRSNRKCITDGLSTTADFGCIEFSMKGTSDV